MISESATLRRAVQADAAALAGFAERCFRDTFARDNSAENMDAYVADTFGEDLQRAELAEQSSVVLVAELSGELAGYAHMRRAPVPAESRSSSAIELKRFYVSSEWHGSGLAHRLMRAVLDVAAAQGVDVTWLAVWDRNPRATSFYRKFGFTPAGTQRFLLGRDEQIDTIMIRNMRG